MYYFCKSWLCFYYSTSFFSQILSGIGVVLAYWWTTG